MKLELPVKEALTSFAEKTLSMVLSQQMLAVYRVITLEAQRFPDLGRLFYEKGAGKIVRFLTRYFADKTRQGELAITHPEVAAEQFIDAVVGMPRMRAVFGVATIGGGEKTLRIKVAVRAFLKAYGAG